MGTYGRMGLVLSVETSIIGMNDCSNWEFPIQKKKTTTSGYCPKEEPTVAVVPALINPQSRLMLFHVASETTLV